jgi:hypothetical protein
MSEELKAKIEQSIHSEPWTPPGRHAVVNVETNTISDNNDHFSDESIRTLGKVTTEIARTDGFMDHQNICNSKILWSVLFIAALAILSRLVESNMR